MPQRNSDIMLIKNLRIYTSKHIIQKGMLRVNNGIITEVILDDSSNKTGDNSAYYYDDDEIIDGYNYLVIPGMIDIHLHGAMGFDFSDGDFEGFKAIAEYELKNGVTGFVPAIMTLPVENIKQVIREVKKYTLQQSSFTNTATVYGLNLEGPFISEIKAGAQNKNHILDFDFEIADDILKEADGLIKFFGIAPEKENGISFTKGYSDRVNISLAHSDADYETSMNAINNGANHITHIFNGMREFGHREPGIAGAFLDSEKEVTAELICDGHHVHKSFVRMVFDLKGEHIALISDSIRATGLKDGIYDLGGQSVKVTNDKAVLENTDVLAGSITLLHDCFKKAVFDMKIDPLKAIRAVTEIPAKALGIFDSVGSIESGKIADLVFLNDDYNIEYVMKNGSFIERN